MKSLFSFYAIYQDQTIAEARKLRGLARYKSFISVAIDIDFYPPSFHARSRTGLSQYRYTFDYLYSYIKWLANCYLKRHFVIPFGLLCTFYDCLFFRFHFNNLSTRFKSFSDLHKQLSRDQSFQPQYIDELMATYIRYVADFSELYGLKTFNPEIIAHFFARLFIFKFAVKIVVYLFRPSCYFTMQRSYLHKYVPCQACIDLGIPVFILGCPDKTLIKSSRSSVPMHWEPSYIFELTIPENYFRSTEAEMSTRIQDSVIDKSISYMSISPYSIPETKYSLSSLGLDPDRFNLFDGRNLLHKKGFVCVYMHEFNDYHHNGTLAPFASSYYEWLLVILRLLDSNRVPYVLKLHPAVLNEPYKDKYAASLRALNLMPSMLSSPINLSLNHTSLELISRGMVLGVTMKGTIATELTYLRIPCLCSGHPPYKYALPNRVKNTIKELEEALIAFDDQPKVTSDEYQRMICYMYFMRSRVEDPASTLSIESASALVENGLNTSLFLPG